MIILPNKSYPMRDLDFTQGIGLWGSGLRRRRTAYTGACVQGLRIWSIKATTTSGSNTVSLLNTSMLRVGYKIASANIPVNTFITSINDNISFTISANATGNGSVECFITDDMPKDIPCATETGTFSRNIYSSTDGVAAYVKRETYFVEEDEINHEALLNFGNSGIVPASVGCYKLYNQFYNNSAPYMYPYASDFRYMPKLLSNPFSSYVPSASAWANDTVYATGICVRPTVANGRYYIASVGGTSGGSEPTWTTSLGDTIVDNGVTWTCIQYPVGVSQNADAGEIPKIFGRPALLFGRDYMDSLALTSGYAQPTGLRTAYQALKGQNPLLNVVALPTNPSYPTGETIIGNNDSYRIVISSTNGRTYFTVPTGTGEGSMPVFEHHKTGQSYIMTGMATNGVLQYWENGVLGSTTGTYTEGKLYSDNYFAIGCTASIGSSFTGLVQDATLLDGATDKDRQIIELTQAKYFRTSVINSLGSNQVHNIVCDGNSIMNGYQIGSVGEPQTNLTPINYNMDCPSKIQKLLGSKFRVSNRGYSNRTTETQITDAAQYVDKGLNLNNKTNIVITFEGHNSIKVGGKTASQAFSAMVTYCLARRAAGWKVIVCTMPYATTIAQATEDSYNNKIRGIRGNSTAYVLNDYITVNGSFFKCTTAGTTAGSPPTFDTTIGNTTTDGTAVWTCMAENYADLVCDVNNMCSYLQASSFRGGVHPNAPSYEEMASIMAGGIIGLIYKIDPTLL